MSRLDPLSDPPHPKYQTVKYLNEGSFGFVVQAKCKVTGYKAAIKFIERGGKVNQYVEREIHNHRALDHPHIIKFKEVFVTNTHLGIAMEYAAGGDLFDRIRVRGRLSEIEARWFFQQLICAVDYMHDRGVVNRDIKLENSLLTDHPKPMLKVCDFGYSKNENKDSLPKSMVGTSSYFAPEVIMSNAYDGKAADIWSCGVMLYTMVTGQYPFDRPEDGNSRQKNVVMRILKMDFQIPDFLSEECKDILSKILVQDPSKRLTMAEIQAHPFYTPDLPPGYMEQIQLLKLRPLPEGHQSVENVNAVLKEAKVAPCGMGDEDLIEQEIKLAGFNGMGSA